MDYFVSDFYNTFSGKIRLVAGVGGLSRKILDVGILDYELEIGLKDRYRHINFHENQLIISTCYYIFAPCSWQPAIGMGHLVA